MLLRITAGPYVFTARMEDGEAPQTCAAFKGLLPWRNKIIQARWSGEAAWIPLGDFKVGVGYENHTSHPAPGEILLYPGGFSETEILFPYGATCFASKATTVLESTPPLKSAPTGTSATKCRRTVSVNFARMASCQSSWLRRGSGSKRSCQ